ncbi:hypothetical protein LG634_24585 [Streptomyces bambusae]|uniref:hypothetical protein n=1 Tax=Streptomyces bambusae TaxID=1550616 RepID=UPI001CFD673E|nr:hypothetical protein [Streptomyces bambusae]MCB5167991.1 hypothetical protein [Streptomyces bambusae]
MSYRPEVEAQIDGVWTSLSADLITEEPITIERGRSARGTRSDPTSVRLSLKGDRYATRNPLSDLYGRFGRGTPLRVSRPGAESYLSLPGTATAYASTPDHASLDITGDIDIRCEASIVWSAVVNQALIGKWESATAQRSYALSVSQGTVSLRFSTTGGNSLFYTLSLPATLPRRAALRGTLDVNNGAGGFTAALYWAESLDGPWTLIGSASDTSLGVITLFSSTSDLKVPPLPSGFNPTRGRIHRAEVRSGIGGTIVAAPDLRGLTPGTTMWTDSAGRPWTTTSDAEITNRQYRAHVEATNLGPPRWDTAGQFIRTPVHGAGILDRLTQGSVPLKSALRRRIPSGSPLAYWPMEDAPAANRVASPLPGVASARVTGFTFGADDSMPGSAALPAAGASATLTASVPATTATGWQVECVYRIDQSPPAGFTQVLRVNVSGTGPGGMAAAILYVSTGGLKMELRDASDAVIVDATFNNAAATSQFFNRWNRLAIFTAPSGGDTQVVGMWRDINGTGGYSYVVTAYTGLPGNANGITGTWGTALEGIRIGHLAAFAATGTPHPGAAPGNLIFDGADDAYNGETAITRIGRLSLEEAATLDITTDDGDYTTGSMRLGPQPIATIVSLLEECAEADGGILYERADRLGLFYRDRATLYNQTPRLVLDYASGGHIAPPLELAERLADVVNDMTVKRRNGSSARATRGDGPLSTAPPPAGAGPRPQETELSLYDDSTTGPIAGWLVHLGTPEQPHFPKVRILLHKAVDLIDDVLALEIGDLIRLTNLPPWLSPDDVDLIVEGYEESWPTPHTWVITLNCTPGSLWTVGVVDDAELGRVDTDGSVLGRDATSSDTTLIVATVQEETARHGEGAQDPADYPLDLRVGGEVVTASAAAELLLDTYTRTVAAGSWGTATDGHSWVLAGGSNSERSVASGRGVVTISSSQTTLRAQTVAEECRDAEILATVAVSQTSTGGSQTPCVLLRYLNTTDHYRVRLHFTTGGNTNLAVCRGSTQIDANVSLGFTYSAGDQFRIRARLIGHRVLAKAWPITGAEPAAWQIDRTITSSTIESGAVGVGAVALSGNTNTGVEFRFDDVIVPTPQRITVTRAVNGIVKTQSAGTDVRLATPTITAL